MQYIKSFIYKIVLFSTALLLYGCNTMGYSWFSNDAIGIDGYDPVAYFHSHQAIPGLNEYNYYYADKTWYFSSEQNRLDFIGQPHHYAPQYHGYSAYDMAQGNVRSANPHNWDIVNNKLYLNSGSSTQEKWRQDRYHYIKLANRQWIAYLREQQPHRQGNNASSQHGRAYSPSPYYRDSELTGRELRK